MPSIHAFSVRRSSASASGVRQGSNASGTFAASAFSLLDAASQFLPERFGRVRRQPLAADHDRRFRILFADVEELELELLGVCHPGRMIGSDQLAAALDVLAGHQVREAQDAATDSIAGLDDGDDVSRPRELVRGRQAAEPSADDDDASRLSLRGDRGKPLAQEHAGRRGERALHHVAARDARRAPHNGDADGETVRACTVLQEGLSSGLGPQGWVRAQAGARQP